MSRRLRLTDTIRTPLYREQCGADGAPMLFVHPWPNDRSCWTYQLAHFSTWFRTVAVDLPGFGMSPPVESGVTMLDYASACWRTLDKVSREPAILVGLSVGSTIVKYMAHLRPKRTRALILTGGPFYSRPDSPDVPIDKPFGYAADTLSADGLASRRALLARNFSPRFRRSSIGEYFLDLFTERNASADLGSMLTLMDALRPADPPWLHRGIACPVLIIMGGLERQRSQRAHRALHGQLAGSEMRVIEGAGHCCNMEKPWEYDRHVIEFLRRHGLMADSTLKEALGVPYPFAEEGAPAPH